MSRQMAPNQPSYEHLPPAPGEFEELRSEIAYRLFRDPSYSVFDAMSEMSTGAEEYIGRLAQQYPGIKLWVGGSLGRREMLPNSDIDLFVIYGNSTYEKSGIRVEGVDKFELGHIDTESLRDLLNYSLIDANHFIDGRRFGSTPAPEVDQMILEANTPDHQLANIISEYFFYRYFDFPEKTTPMGPNMKYSTGSSRDTIFFNMISRMSTGDFPAVRGSQPELAQVMADSESRYGIRAPYRAVNLLFTVKNAAISVYDATGDPRSRYVSHVSLEAIYEFGKDKFRAWGIRDAQQFISDYAAARQELEYVVDTIFTKSVAEHPAAEGISKLLSASRDELPQACLDVIQGHADYPHSLAAFGTWLLTRDNPAGSDIDEVARALMGKPLDQSWGGLMAVACSSATPDNTLSQLADWLYVNEKGAYLTKLITRNRAASPETRAKALGYYRAKEIIT